MLDSELYGGRSKPEEFDNGAILIVHSMSLHYRRLPYEDQIPHKINLETHPERVNQMKEKLFASMISREMHVAFGMTGLVIEVSKRAILYASNRDSGGPSDLEISKYRLRQRAPRTIIHDNDNSNSWSKPDEYDYLIDPEELIALSDKPNGVTSPNELLILPEHKDDITLTGFFIEDGTQEYNLAWAEAQSFRTGLPLVTIPRANIDYGYED